MTVEPSTRRATAPEPVANQSGKQPKMNANDVIRMGRSRNRAPSSAASSSGLPFSYSSFANSTIRIAFFRSKADKHDQANLGVDIVLHPAQPKCEERAKHRDRRSKQNTEWQRPTLVQRSQ